MNLIDMGLTEFQKNSDTKKVFAKIAYSLKLASRNIKKKDNMYWQVQKRS